MTLHKRACVAGIDLAMKYARGARIGLFILLDLLAGRQPDHRRSGLAARAFVGGIEIVDLPSPGRVEIGGELAAASYMNFYIGNSVVVVPTYDVANDTAAVDALAAIFPERRVLGVPARGIIVGGGSFHCSSQQVPC